jgi:predicted nucleic acid-binding protein
MDTERSLLRASRVVTAFLDTNIAVYAHDHSSGPKQEAAAAVIAARADELVVSTQVLAEFYWVTSRRLEPPLPHDAARDATAALGALPVVSTDAALVLAAIDCAAVNHIALWDAMIVTAARRAGCDEILTEDLNDGQVIDGVLITNPLQ